MSVAIPTLNSETTLDTTILSLKNQRDVEVVIIVVDSGSKDGTLDICRHWNVEVKYFQAGNMYGAVNEGLKSSSSEWLTYLNSDDWIYPDSFSRLISYGDKSNADLVYGKCDFTDVHGRFMYSFSPPFPNQLNSIVRTGRLGFAQQATVFRNCLYTKLNGFDVKYKFSADKDFYIRALQANATFSFLTGSPVSCFRLHTKQLSSTKAELMEHESKQINQCLVQPPNLYDFFIKTNWQLRNIPNYLIRFMRQSMLSERIVLARSIYPGFHIE
ncbi:MAG: glycosyltransferase [Leptolyngbyaceae cyanobacterium SL_1_1]|nr:glycosyltransferase [Calothrix sp. SM1_7_51]NJN02350.1 glycosyltransferase [Leptolyngbyaceae cyanobacterium RM1_1_2]NJO10383.1 glycosyltransferase [Leptolyngbyaceae cyanobacterium SL_1_1]